MGLEPCRLVTLASGRRESFLCMSAFFLTCKMKVLELEVEKCCWFEERGQVVKW